MIRRSLKALYERGEAKICGLNFLAVDKEGGKADIVSRGGVEGGGYITVPPYSDLSGVLEKYYS